MGVLIRYAHAHHVFCTVFVAEKRREAGARLYELDALVPFFFGHPLVIPQAYERLFEPKPPCGLHEEYRKFVRLALTVFPVPAAYGHVLVGMEVGTELYKKGVYYLRCLLPCQHSLFDVMLIIRVQVLIYPSKGK